MDRAALGLCRPRRVPNVCGPIVDSWRRGRESATFEYETEWLQHNERFALEPALTLGPGPHHTASGRALFGAIGDSAPDRWGRTLMRRAERMRRSRGAAAGDTHGGGFPGFGGRRDQAGCAALRGARRGPFLARAPSRIPPLVQLPKLLQASERVIGEIDSEEDLRLLLAPGSSLGGARPKASVRDRDGDLAIAKFPHKDDDIDVEKWEAVALSLAGKAGIRVPKWRIEAVARRTVLLLGRFDRLGGTRIPFLSAMSMLGAADDESHSYLEIVDAIRQYGSDPRADTQELWRRIVFNVLVSNTDDHLRNHGFLYERGKGWRLSPAYDLNPVPLDVRPHVLTTAITPDDDTASLGLAFEVADYFGVRAAEARRIAGEVGLAVSHWRDHAARIALDRVAVDRMASAFEHDDLRQSMAMRGPAS